MAADVLAGGVVLWWVGVGVVSWVTIGLVAALVLARRGHDLKSVIGLAVVLGPLFLPWAWDAVRHREQDARSVRLVRTPSAPGRHAMVAVLDSPERVADAIPVLRSFGSVGSVTLVATIDYESARRGAADEVRRETAHRLAAAAMFLPGHPCGQVLVPGTPADAIARLAGSPDASPAGVPPPDLIVVTGAGPGSGVERLSTTSGIPVVVVPPTSS